MADIELISRKEALDALTLVIKTYSIQYVPQYARRALKNIQAIDAVPVVRCKDCQHCTLLADGAGFYCAAWHTDFYTPHYDAGTYYCADGKVR